MHHRDQNTPGDGHPRVRNLCEIVRKRAGGAMFIFYLGLANCFLWASIRCEGRVRIVLVHYRVL